MRRTRDSHSRSFAKAVSWRILGTMATGAIVYIVTRRWSLAGLAIGMDFVSKIALFWVHEQLWDRVTYGKKEAQPSVVWFTGLSGSGKSTIAERVAQELKSTGLKVEYLDGDSVRAIFPSTGFTRPERDAHVKRIGFLASKLESQGVFVVASFVSPYRESRGFVRQQCRSFIEVHVATPLEECEKRDVKGLYARARRGEIANFTGISDPYEAPDKAEFVLDTTKVPLEESVRQVVAEVRKRTGIEA